MISIATAFAVLLAASAASAQPLPVPKVGQCPDGAPAEVHRVAVHSFRHLQRRMR
jgi:hypothetical protein